MPAAPSSRVWPAAGELRRFRFGVLRGVRLSVIAGSTTLLLLCVGPANAHSVSKPRSTPRPVFLSLTYGRFRPAGATKSYFAFRLRAREARGQVVEVDFQEIDRRGAPVGVGGDALSRCGIGGRHSGGIETFYLPVAQKLKAGTHRVRVVAYGSACVRGRPRRSSQHIFIFNVPQRNPLG